jgi:hypothetical protein
LRVTEKARGVEVAAARHIHDLGNNCEATITSSPWATTHGRAGDHGDFAILAQRLQPRQILRQVERLDFGFVAKTIDVLGMARKLSRWRSTQKGSEA